MVTECRLPSDCWVRPIGQHHRPTRAEQLRPAIRTASAQWPSLAPIRPGLPSSTKPPAFELTTAASTVTMQDGWAKALAHEPSGATRLRRGTARATGCPSLSRVMGREQNCGIHARRVCRDVLGPLACRSVSQKSTCRSSMQRQWAAAGIRCPVRHAWCLVGRTAARVARRTLQPDLPRCLPGRAAAQEHRRREPHSPPPLAQGSSRARAPALGQLGLGGSCGSVQVRVRARSPAEECRSGTPHRPARWGQQLLRAAALVSCCTWVACARGSPAAPPTPRCLDTATEEGDDWLMSVQHITTRTPCLCVMLSWDATCWDMTSCPLWTCIACVQYRLRVCTAARAVPHLVSCRPEPPTAAVQGQQVQRKSELTSMTTRNNTRP